MTQMALLYLAKNLPNGQNNLYFQVLKIGKFWKIVDLLKFIYNPDKGKFVKQ